MPDWRLGKKDCGNNVNADWTCRPCGRFNLAIERFCQSCKKENPNWVEIEVNAEGRAGRVGGHFDRPDPDEPKNNWNSDDEDIDEFGRKKKKPAAKAVAASNTKRGISDKQAAALERLKNKGAARKVSRSRSR